MSSTLEFLARRLRHAPSFFRFAIVGGIATTVDFFFFNIVLGGSGDPSTPHLLAAATTGFIFATYSSYQLNSRFTFRAARSSGALGRYFGVATVGLLIHNATLLMLRGWLDPGTVLELNAVKLGALGASMVWNYFGYRHVAFRASPERPELTSETVAVATVSLVIPTYNEEQRITSTLDLLIADAEPFQLLEVVIVDDGSHDRTAELVTARAAETDLPIHLIQLPRNRGKGAALRAGAAEAVGDYVAFLDADLSTTTSAIPRALAAIEAGADVVIGTRISPDGVDFRRTQPRIRQLSGRIFVALRRLIVGLPYADTQCPFKLFTKQAARLVYPEVQTDGWSFDVELLARARQHNLRIIELPVHWRHVGGSQLHTSPWTALRVLRELISIRVRVGRA